MNISQKMAYTRRSIENISQHHDVDGAVRKAALDQVKAFCDEQASVIDAEVAAKVAAIGPAGG